MKKIFIIIFLLLTVYFSQGQIMQQKAQWVTIAVPQLKCWTCKERLENYLLREKGPTGDAGIITWTVNMRAGTIKIQYAPERINIDYLRTAINNAGFDADSTKATEDSYKMLPPICKRAAEGGGPQKGKPPCNLPPED